MDHAEYVYTRGMTDEEVDERLEAESHGVLALADGDDAYALPLSHHYDGDRLLLRVSVHEHAEKVRYLETTDTATFVCYDATEEGSWSVHVRGPIAPSDVEIDDTTLNEWFPPFRLFDEEVAEVEFVLYELGTESVTGRTTLGE
ncbi:MAG: pyridoxamine 5'-phosphate oxidase family protein [Haloarculaceae archaeon]